MQTTDATVTLTIDGKEVKVRPGTTVLQACREAGMYVPYLCWHPILKPYGACRVCVVEIEERGRKTRPTSCTTTVNNGMIITTQNADLEKLRKDVVFLTLSEHPHGCLTCHRIEHCLPTDVCQRNVSVTDRCVICPQNGRCELQDVVYHMGIGSGTSVPLPYTYKQIPLEISNPFIHHDMNLCIMCGRCVRSCNELEGVDAITFVDRGDRTVIGTSFGGSLADSGCTYCGACVDVCPVGAIVEKDSKWAGASDHHVSSVCSDCSVGCGLELQMKGDKFLRPFFRESSASNGQTCVRGKFGTSFVNSSKRILNPMVRKNGKLEETTWDEALKVVAENLSQHKGNHFAALTAGRSTNEEAYLLQKFARAVMGTNNVYHIDPILPQDFMTGLIETLGTPAMSNSLADLSQTKCVLAFEADATTDHPVLGARLRKFAQEGKKLMVIDPRETEISLFAAHSLRPRRGTELSLLAGMMRVILDEGIADQKFVQERCENLDSLRNSLATFDLDSVARATGVSKALIQEAARVYATTKPAAVLYSGALLDGEGSAISAALANLALLTGNVGIPGGGVNPLKGESNSQGSADMGCLPDTLPGYQALDKGAAFAQAWGSQVPSNKGIPFDGLIKAISNGSIKAVYFIGERASLPLGDRDLVAALKKASFLVVQDVFLSEAAQSAQVVLPAAAFAEKDGTLTNMERRIQRLHKAKEPKGNSRAGWEIITGAAKAMGAKGFDYNHPSQVMDEIARLVPIYAGVSYERLDGKGLSWPCTRRDHPGTAILYAEGFPGGKARFAPIQVQPVQAETNPSYPLQLLSAVFREIKGVKELGHQVILEFNSEDARPLGVEDGDLVDVVYPGDKVQARARLSERAPSGAVYAQFPHSEVMTELYQKFSTDSSVARLGLVKNAWVRLEKASR